ncbi:glycosyl transferase [Cellulomonas shaoxiangyii]|uniref:Glycosyl transferase n=1 Tax=Cellulomonas shaoxiangyii TaxID=2566013 RepID=A0A4V1CN71_9CELL|nr:glycosyl transferase [Cellulomonas shaoxiangyii]TGY85173.1 glycosyl transferase [Cellulomonas shaoxiangyii]
MRVLQPFGRIRPTTNPYIAMLHAALERTAGVEPVLFSYPRALVGRYDVVHLHWPETRLGGRGPVRRALRLVLAYAFWARLRLTRTPVVRTVHNLELPSGLGRLDYAWLRLLERATTLHVVLNETTPPTGRPSVTVLHGHYRDWFRETERTDAVPGQVTYAGLVRRYKNVVGLVRAFRDAHAVDPSLSLLVAGNPSGPDLEAEVRAAAHGADAIRLDLRFLDDADLVRAVTSGELVVLPYLHMHNSGTVLLALSLDRPVLVPDNEANRALAQEVGPGWVLTFEGELGAAAIRRALDEARGPRARRPDLSRREWDDAGVAHREAYHEALRLRRGTRTL